MRTKPHLMKYLMEYVLKSNYIVDIAVLNVRLICDTLLKVKMSIS